MPRKIKVDFLTCDENLTFERLILLVERYQEDDVKLKKIGNGYEIIKTVPLIYNITHTPCKNCNKYAFQDFTIEESEIACSKIGEPVVINCAYCKNGTFTQTTTLKEGQL